MVEKSINAGIMESIQKYMEKISKYYKIEAIISSDFSDIIEDGAKLIGLTWKIDTRIEPHPITTENFKKISNPFVKEVVETGIKVA